MQLKNRYELELGKRVGPIELGMSRQTIISILGPPDISKEGKLSLKDYYHLKNLHIDYVPDTKICEGIEVTNEAELLYNGVNLLGVPWAQMLQWLQEYDPSLKENVGIYISQVLRLSTGPKFDFDSGTEIVESIVVFTEDYWPSDEERILAIKKEIEESPSVEEMSRELGLEEFFLTIRIF